MNAVSFLLIEFTFTSALLPLYGFLSHEMRANNAIAFLAVTVNGEAVAEDVTALFLGKNRPLNAEEFTLDEAGVMQAIIDALNVDADSNG